MKLPLAIAAGAVAALLAGCANMAIGLRSTNSPSLPSNTLTSGSSQNSATIQAQVKPGAFLGLVFLGYLAAGAHDDYRRSRDGDFARAAPELDEDRGVAERDCSQPLGTLYANLRCR